MRRALIAALLVAPLALSAACSDDPVVPALVAVPDGGTIAPVDTGSAPPDSGPVDTVCTCQDEDPETIDFCAPSTSCAYLTFHETFQTELRGESGDASELAMCPKPSVLVGINATATGPLKRVSPVCGTPRVVKRPSLAIDFTEQNLPLGVVAEGKTTVCSTALAGFSGRSVGIGQDRISQFVGRCATVAIASPGAKELKLSMGTSAERIVVGPDGPDAFLAAAECPAGAVAIGMRLRKSGDEVVAIGLVCGEPWVWYE